MNLRIITKNHAANPQIGFLTKSISKLIDRATAMPLAWELSWNKTQLKNGNWVNSCVSGRLKDLRYHLLSDI